MIISGFDKIAMKRALDYYLCDQKGGFYTRKVPNGPVKKTSGMTKTEIEEENNKVKNDFAFLYLSIFYNKTPEDFKTDDYKKASSDSQIKISRMNIRNQTAIQARF